MGQISSSCAGPADTFASEPIELSVEANDDEEVPDGSSPTAASISEGDVAGAGRVEAEEEDDDEGRGIEEARRLLHHLRPIEAADSLELQSGTASSERTVALKTAIEQQLQALERALVRLGAHPGLQDQAAADGSPSSTCTGGSSSSSSDDATPPGRSSMSLRVPMSPAAAKEQAIAAAQKCQSSQPKVRDIIDISFELDDAGHSAEGVLEFFPDGTVSIQWVAKDLPVSLAHAVAFIHEVDLLVDMVPFLVGAEVLHQFPGNAADRLVRMASRPPIPFVTGLEVVSQRYGFDLLDTPWAGLCLVDCGPHWTAPEPGGAQKQRPCTYRGVPKPPPFASGFRSVDVKNLCALARPSGRRGELTTIICAASGDLKVPRSLLPNWLITYLVKFIGRMVFARVMDKVAKFDTSEYGARIRGNQFYQDLSDRIDRHVASEVFGG